MRYILIKISLGLASWLTKSTRLCCSGFLAVASAEGNQSNLMRWRARDASSISTWVKRYSTSEKLHIKRSLSPALVVIVVLLSYVSFWSCRRRAQNLHNLIMSSLCVRFANVCVCVSVVCLCGNYLGGSITIRWKTISGRFMDFLWPYIRKSSSRGISE